MKYKIKLDSLQNSLTILIDDRLKESSEKELSCELNGKLFEGVWLYLAEVLSWNLNGI